MTCQPVYITPSITNGIFTAGKAYLVRECGPAQIIVVVDDQGCERCVSLPLGQRCPHLMPWVRVCDTPLPDAARWAAAGHWWETGVASRAEYEPPPPVRPPTNYAPILRLLCDAIDELANGGGDPEIAAWRVFDAKLLLDEIAAGSS